MKTVLFSEQKKVSRFVFSHEWLFLHVCPKCCLFHFAALFLNSIRIYERNNLHFRSKTDRRTATVSGPTVLLEFTQEIEVKMKD